MSYWHSVGRDDPHQQSSLLGLSATLTHRPAGSKVISVPKDVADLQAALEQASAGDCVCVSAGEYTLAMPLRLKKDIHLIGLDDGMTGVRLVMDNGQVPVLPPDQQRIYTKYDAHLLTVDPPTAARISNITFLFVDSKRSSKKLGPPSELLFCAFLRGGNVLVDRCTFQCSFASCVGVSPECVATVLNCTFLPSREYGIFVCRDARGFRSSKCRLDKCGTGVFMDECSAGVIEENSLTNCEISIELTAGTHVVVRKNVVEGSSDVGVYVSSGVRQATAVDIVGVSVVDGVSGGGLDTHSFSSPLGGVTISSNSIVNSNIGIHVENFACAKIYKNVISNNRQCGIKFSDHGTGCVMFNEVYSNTDGIVVAGEPSPTPTISKNSIHTNLALGVHASGRNTVCVIKDNDIFENEVCGVQLEAGAVGSVLANRVYQNHDLGIAVLAGCAAEVCENSVTQNRGSGIHLHDTLPSLLCHNLVEGNKGNVGIEISGLCRPLLTTTFAASTSADTTMTNFTLVVENTVVSNLKSGIDIAACAALLPPSEEKEEKQAVVVLELQRNEVRLNDGSGVCVREGSRGVRVVDTSSVTANVHGDVVVNSTSQAELISSAVEVRSPPKFLEDSRMRELS